MGHLEEASERTTRFFPFCCSQDRRAPLDVLMSSLVWATKRSQLETRAFEISARNTSFRPIVTRAKAQRREASSGSREEHAFGFSRGRARPRWTFGPALSSFVSVECRRRSERRFVLALGFRRFCWRQRIPRKTKGKPDCVLASPNQAQDPNGSYVGTRRIYTEREAKREATWLPVSSPGATRSMPR